MLPLGVVQQAAGGGGAASFAVDTDGDLVSKLLFYSFQEDATDASGNVADGTEANVTHSAGIIGNKGVYNGTNAVMTFGDVLDFERTDSRSWSFWAAWTDTVNNVIMSKGGNTALTGTGWLIASYVSAGTGQILLGLCGTGAANALYAYAGDAAWDDGTLRHFVITYDGTSAASGVKVYVNGSLAGGTGNYGDALVNNITNTSNFLIGNDPDGSFFHGSADEIAMFSGVLTANNISDMYNSGSGNVFTP